MHSGAFAARVFEDPQLQIENMQLQRHFVCILLFFFVSLIASQHKNVCSSMTSYTTFLIERSESCWYNEDVGKSSQELMETYNDHFETHKVTTKDGYILTRFRIRGNGKPILLVHGLFSTSRSFLLIGKRSHAFVLSEQGYDIWLANLRGSIYSNQHADETISEADYWNFSFQETAFYDIPALIDEIREIRRNEGLEDKKVIPIGWTMAFSALNIYATFNKTHAEENIAALVALSPIQIIIENPVFASDEDP